VESESGPSSIPTLQTIDTAYQEVTHLPILIDQANHEHAQLSQQIEQSIAEIETIRADKEALAIETAVLKEKLRVAREETQRFGEAALRIKRDFDEFVEKTGANVPK
jgi:seryl-tRNA synthetase